MEKSKVVGLKNPVFIDSLVVMNLQMAVKVSITIVLTRACLSNRYYPFCRSFFIKYCLIILYKK